MDLDLDDDLDFEEQMDWMEEAQEIDKEEQRLKEQQEQQEKERQLREEQKKARNQQRIELNMTEEERQQYLIKQREQHNKELAEDFLSDDVSEDQDEQNNVQSIQRNYDLEDDFFGGQIEQQTEQAEDELKELKTDQDYKQFGKKLGQLFAKSYTGNHDEYYQNLQDTILYAIEKLEVEDLKILCDFCFMKLSKDLQKRN